MRRQTHLPKALLFMALYGCSSTSENTPVERGDAGTQATDAGTEQRVVSVLAEDTFEVEVTEDVVFARVNPLRLADIGRDAHGSAARCTAPCAPKPRRCRSWSSFMAQLHGRVTQEPEFAPLATSFASCGWVALDRLSRRTALWEPPTPEVPEGADERQGNQWHALYPARCQSSDPLDPLQG